MNRRSRRLLTVGSAIVLAATAAGAAGAALSPKAEAASIYVANIPPGLADPTTLLTNEPFRVGIWKNFQKFVHGCMLGNDVFTYKELPAPAGVTVGNLPQFSATGDSFNLASQQTYILPLASASSVNISSNADAKYYQKWLRGKDLVTISDYSQADYGAYDGVSFERFGVLPSDTAGCEAAGRAAVSEPAVAAMKRLTPSIDLFIQDLATNSQFLELQDTWATCMQQSGYDYSDLAEPVTMLSSEMSTITDTSSSSWTAFKAKEQATATKSRSCMVSSGVQSFIDGELTTRWNSFVAVNISDLQIAGGMTMVDGLGAA